MPSRILYRLLIVSGVLLVLTFAVSTVSQLASAQGACLDSVEQEVLTLVNNERTSRGLSPLHIDCRLAAAAQTHNDLMAQQNQLSHQLPGERPLAAQGPNNDRYDAVNYPWTYAAENVAAGQTTPQQVMNDWMNSSGHRANILSANARDIGIAHTVITYTPAPGQQSRTVHWWTQDFGTATDSPPPPSQNADTTGVFRPSNGNLYLKNQNTSGFADVAITYGAVGDKSIAGDWNGDGIDTIGVYRNGVFLLRNSNTTGFADISIPFGGAGDLPVVGDWNGDGVDTIGVYRNGLFYLRNANTAGPSEITLMLGGSGDVPISGDWNADGIDTLGVFRPSNGNVYLRNTNTSGVADLFFFYGQAGDKPVAGDWNGDTIDTIGIYRNGTFYLRNSNTTGIADISFQLGGPGDEPIAGDWNGLP